MLPMWISPSPLLSGLEQIVPSGVPRGDQGAPQCTPDSCVVADMIRTVFLIWQVSYDADRMNSVAHLSAL